MNTFHVEDLIPAYALGALEADERQTLESHADQCAYCNALLRHHLEAVGMLAAAVPTATPPVELRERILSEADSYVAHTLSLGVPTDAGPIMRSRLARWAVPVFSAAAGISVLFLGVLLGLVLNLQGEVQDLNKERAKEVEDLNEQRASLISMIDAERTLSYVTAIPGTETMMLENTGTTMSARGMLILPVDHSWGYLVSQGMEPMRETMGYQVWFIKNGDRISGGIFTVDETGHGQIYFRFPSDYRELTQLGITMEPKDGSPEPTSPAILTAQFK